MKTAMQELISEIKKRSLGFAVYLNANLDLVNEALQKERQQIEDVYKKGISDGIAFASHAPYDFENSSDDYTQNCGGDQ